MHIKIEVSPVDIINLGLGDREYFINMYWFSLFSA
jgi:hypothetical protein